MGERKGIILLAGEPTVSGDASGFQTTAARLRQADDLLPADDADAGGHSSVDTQNRPVMDT